MNSAKGGAHHRMCKELLRGARRFVRLAQEYELFKTGTHFDSTAQHP
ncbi:MAG: hypothetical protein ABI165_16800 [Bryobacteraceae bacterium]